MEYNERLPLAIFLARSNTPTGSTFLAVDFRLMFRHPSLVSGSVARTGIVACEVVGFEYAYLIPRNQSVWS